MATSMLEFEGRFKSFKDLDLLMLLHLMISNASNDQDGSVGANAVMTSLAEVCETYAPGVIDLKLDALLSDESRRHAFHSILSKVVCDLESGEPIVPASVVLSRWRARGVKPRDYSSDLLRSAARDLHSLLSKR